ncbi:alanyl-tRNA editing protein [Thermohalobacter berrensis]|uniref:Alanyl-transfer RNA synthetases family profile domain-containing protein n=1 Tax=Thermohalobacter berrensis TaxID=99594 RepID=A0A419T553_9FIRM|nr:DHHA1 domain-containing protein [Thermohalobacter berrensis]RKD32576.1 hypothetical protein BET03_10905 [Thermohalobacter berrensis]
MTEKLYLENPYLREISAKIVKKEYSNNKFYLTLNRTIFYPHMSGGQPKDTGTIDGVKVIDVYEKNNEIIHVVEENIKKDKVHLSLDWNTRFDHMQQHTGQHILSAAIAKLFNAKTVGFYIGKEYTYIDVTLSNLEKKDIEWIERYANEIVFSNFNIKKYVINEEDIHKLPLRKKPSVKKNIRIVEIDGIDYSPCAGTHHTSTGEVGMIKIKKWDRYKDNTRIEFICGNRALKDYTWKNYYINEISNLLSLKDKDTLKGVKRIYDENKKLLKEVKEMKEELLKYTSEKLINMSKDYNSFKISNNIFTDIDFKDMRYMASIILNNYDNIILIWGLKNENKAQILLGKSKNIKIDIKEIFNNIIDIIDGRGGGSPYLVQGGGENIENLSICMQSGLRLIQTQLNAQ